MDYTCPRHGYTSGDDRNAIRGSCCIPMEAVALSEALALLDRRCALCGSVLPFDYDHVTCESCISAGKLL